MPLDQTIHFRKADDEKQIVYGVVYAPDELDSHGHFADAEAIEDMAHNFLKNAALRKSVDTKHDGKSNGSYPVESFIARKNDPDFPEGAWVLGVKVIDGGLWEKIKKHEINGFSLDGNGLTEEVDIEMDVPHETYVETEPDPEDGHVHVAVLKLSESGRVATGCTDEVNGHTHIIKRGTVTEESDGHRHRFAY